jgi:hypothetical protein
LSAIEMWLREARGTVLDDETPAPKLLKNETLMDAIERLRRRGRELVADLHRVQSAPYPSAHAKQRARAEVEALAARGAISVDRLLEHDAPLEFPTTLLRSDVVRSAAPALAFGEVPDVLGVVAWLHRDALIKRLDAEIDAEADDKEALSHADRQKRSAEVLSDLLEVERHEASLVWRAQSERLPAEHRADCDPRAILGVVLANAPRNGSSPGSTPGLSWPR